MPQRTAATSGLSGPAAAFEFLVVWGTVVGLLAAGLPERVTTGEWLAFGALLPVIGAVHLIYADREQHQGSHLSLAPILAAALLLPPLLTAAAIALAFVPEWARTRARWYIVVFNVANFVGPALGARAVFDTVAARGGTEAWSLAALAAIGTFLALQYAVLAVMLKLSRSVRLADTFRLDCVLIDAGLLCLGAVTAALATEYPALVLLALVPLAVMHRSLAIPGLVEAARIEPKTGLFNMLHFQTALEQELTRAGRFDRPLALLMVDVDHLRQVNNAYGHLAGDRALRLVAETLRQATRDYDVAARFGGDEFCILLPETGEQGAMAVAERVRKSAERAGKLADLPLTVSVGVAAVKGGGTTSEEIVALADRAAYRAKFSGRNAVAIPPEGDPVHEAERVLLDAIRGNG